MTRNIQTGGSGRGEAFYAELRVSEAVFANEWDKRILLTALEGVRELYTVEVYAFCVLDDRIRLLIGGKDVRTSTVRQMITILVGRYIRGTELIGEYDIMPVSASAKFCIVHLEDERDMMSVLRYIHLTPSSEGYALTAGDYWWTSYSTYRGRYCWRVVDAEKVMRILERHDRQALHSLLEYHRRAEAMHNPIPECIRVREYLPLERRPEYIPERMNGENLNETFTEHSMTL